MKQKLNDWFNMSNAEFHAWCWRLIVRFTVLNAIVFMAVHPAKAGLFAPQGCECGGSGTSTTTSNGGFWTGSLNTISGFMFLKFMF